MLMYHNVRMVCDHSMHTPVIQSLPALATAYDEFVQHTIELETDGIVARVSR